MRVRASARFWIELTLGAICAVSAVAVAAPSVWPQWIESLFGADPDNRSGAIEWAIAAGLFALAVTLCFAASREPKGAIATGRSSQALAGEQDGGIAASGNSVSMQG